mmetsp:Transcript_14835/g.40795  ORF Transcript_14835/g.40795 Transcript_14835/m.40795 type:complete len:202 (-) Transcript_14835:995-1600(-)
MSKRARSRRPRRPSHMALTFCPLGEVPLGPSAAGPANSGEASSCTPSAGFKTVGAIEHTTSSSTAADAECFFPLSASNRQTCDMALEGISDSDAERHICDFGERGAGDPATARVELAEKPTARCGGLGDVPPCWPPPACVSGAEPFTRRRHSVTVFRRRISGKAFWQTFTCFSNAAALKLRSQCGHVSNGLIGDVSFLGTL